MPDIYNQGASGERWPPTTYVPPNWIVTGAVKTIEQLLAEGAERLRAARGKNSEE